MYDEVTPSPNRKNLKKIDNPKSEKNQYLMNDVRYRFGESLTLEKDKGCIKY